MNSVGNKYICDSVIMATTDTAYDVIYVSLTGLSRYDVCVNQEHVSLFEDWPSKATIQDNLYMSTGGVGAWDYHNHHFATLLFSGYHKFVDHEQLYYNSILEIIKLQSYLKDLNIPVYYTCMLNQFVADPNNMIPHTCEYGTDRYPKLKKLINKINFDDWILEQGLGMFETCKRLNLLDRDNFHPNKQGYNYWTTKFVDRLKKDKIL